MSDIEFPKGLMVKEKHPKAPDFVICGVSIQRKELGNWLRGKEEDWINLQIKRSKKGELYIAVDNWEPESKPSVATESPVDRMAKDFNEDEDIPF